MMRDHVVAQQRTGFSADKQHPAVADRIKAGDHPDELQPDQRKGIQGKPARGDAPMPSAQSHVHENVRHGGPTTQKTGNQPRVHPAPIGPVPDKAHTAIFKRGRDF
jgi:hypothetical protein